MTLTNEQAEKVLDAMMSIAVESTSDNPSGYGPPFKAPWFIIDTRTAEPEVNWRGELIEQVDEPGKVHEALRRARIAAIIDAVM